MLVSEYLSRVMPSVMGCPIPVAEMAILDSADELCRESRVLRESQDIPLVSGTTEYDLDPVTVGTFAVEVLFARIGISEPLEPVTPDLLNRLIMGTGEPEFIEQVSSDLVRLHPAPKTSEDMSVTMVLSVSPGSASIPSSLDRWRDGIVGGALHRLMSMPNQAWANPQLAVTFRQSFNNALNGATSQATLGNLKAALRTVPCP